jgi:hypothetical protein
MGRTYHIQCRGEVKSREQIKDSWPHRAHSERECSRRPDCRSCVVINPPPKCPSCGLMLQSKDTITTIAFPDCVSLIRVNNHIARMLVEALEKVGYQSERY